MGVVAAAEKLSLPDIYLSSPIRRESSPLTTEDDVECFLPWYPAGGLLRFSCPGFCCAIALSHMTFSTVNEGLLEQERPKCTQA
jgi:hypothetical protein